MFDLDAKQMAVIAAVKAAIKQEGVEGYCQRTGNNRGTIAGILSATASLGGYLVTIHKHEKAFKK